MKRSVKPVEDFDLSDASESRAFHVGSAKRASVTISNPGSVTWTGSGSGALVSFLESADGVNATDIDKGSQLGGPFYSGQADGVGTYVVALNADWLHVDVATNEGGSGVETVNNVL